MNFMSTLKFTLARVWHLQMQIKQLIRSRKCSHLADQIRGAKFLGITSAEHPICYSNPYKNHESNSVVRNLKTTQKSIDNNLNHMMSFAISDAPACSDKEAEPSVPIHLGDGHFPSNHHGCVGASWIVFR